MIKTTSYATTDVYTYVVLKYDFFSLPVLPVVTELKLSTPEDGEMSVKPLFFCT
jgi:hypothetical protein